MKHALIALRLATPTTADCRTAANLATGIAFQREDGRSGLATTDGKNLRIDYSTTNDAWNDNRISRLGVHDLAASCLSDTLPTVGGGSPDYAWSRSTCLSELGPGKRVTAKVTQKRSEVIGTEFTPSAKVTAYQASNNFLEPVEAAYSDGTTQRYLPVPEIGLGLETRTRGIEGQPAQRRGLTALKPAS